MIFRLGDEDPPLAGLLNYTDAEYSFGFEIGSPADLSQRAGESGVTSVLAGTLQIEIGVATRRALYVWGLHPRNRWTSAVLTAPDAEPRAAFFDPDRSFEPGVSISVAPVGAWRTEFDDESGWIRVAPDSRADDAVANIAEGILLGRRDGELHSIWLQPVFK
jgi:hypothetical protein